MIKLPAIPSSPCFSTFIYRFSTFSSCFLTLVRSICDLRGGQHDCNADVTFFDKCLFQSPAVLAPRPQFFFLDLSSSSSTSVLVPQPQFLFLDLQCLFLDLQCLLLDLDQVELWLRDGQHDCPADPTIFNKYIFISTIHSRCSDLFGDVHRWSHYTQ